MFEKSKLTSFDGSFMDNWNLDKVTEAKGMFKECKSLVRISNLNLKAPNATSYFQFFIDCSALKELSGISYDISSLENKNSFPIDYLPGNITSIDGLDFYISDYTKYTGTGYSMLGLFYGNLKNATNVNNIKIDITNSNNVSQLFQNLGQSGTGVFVNNIKLMDNGTIEKNGSYIFQSSNKVTNMTNIEINISNMNNIGQMFSEISRGVDSCTFNHISLIDTGSTPKTAEHFIASSNSGIKITEITDFRFDSQNVTSMQKFLFGCEKLTRFQLVDADGNPTTLNTSEVTNMSQMFSNCKELNDFSSFTNLDTSNVTDMSYMFNQCRKMTTAPFGSNTNTSNVTDMHNMFNTTYLLSSLEFAKNWDVGSVSNFSAMFYETGNQRADKTKPLFASIKDWTGFGNAVTDASGYSRMFYNSDSNDINNFSANGGFTNKPGTINNNRDYVPN